MTQRIGIVACSAEGAALCYRTICSLAAKRMGPHQHPEISMHTFSLADYMIPVRSGDWGGVAAMMHRSGRKLAAAGASFLICPDNTIHQAFLEGGLRGPLPWLSIAEVVARAGREGGREVLGVIGTRPLMEGPVYQEALMALGIERVIPEPADRDRIDQIIFEELVYGVIRETSRRFFYEVIERLKGMGCQAVVLGCTEIPLIVREGESPLPTLDSTRLLAASALEKALEAVPGS
mgnify:CR=1 FL=1